MIRACLPEEAAGAEKQMTIQHRTFGRKFLEALRRYFVSGTLVVAPLIITFVAIRFLFETVDGLLRPVMEKALQYDLPGLGLITTVLLILLVGIIACSYLGSRSLRFGERVLSMFPIVRPIYLAAKQLVDGIAMPKSRAFKEVALIETPRKGLYSICFVVNRPTLQIGDEWREKVCLFVPSTPTPVSGTVVIADPGEVILLDMSVEEGIKFLVSGGIASPQTLRGRKLPAPEPDAPLSVQEDTPV